MSTRSEIFWDIVQEEMAAQGIVSFRELERRGGGSNGLISYRAKDALAPTIRGMYAISKGLRVPMEILEEWAQGRRVKSNTAMERRVVYMFHLLPPEKQRDILTQVRALVEASRELEPQPT